MEDTEGRGPSCTLVVQVEARRPSLSCTLQLFFSLSLTSAATAKLISEDELPESN